MVKKIIHIFKKKPDPTPEIDQKSQPKVTLQRRFVFRVLVPPFVVLLLLGIVVFWQLNSFVHKQAIDQLDRAATTTAAKLEREIAIRQTVLKRTGEELFSIKIDYQTSRQTLDKNRDDCRSYVQQKKSFKGAPNGACDPFLAQFAVSGATLAAIEDGYAQQGNALIHTQDTNISDRLASYKQFFPETVALVVLDNKQQLVSSALSGGFTGTSQDFVATAVSAQKKPIEGNVRNIKGVRLAIFAYPIENGSVLAAYNLDDSSFLESTWSATPIDRKKALAVILDANGQPVYPNSSILADFKPVNQQLRHDSSVTFNVKSVKQIGVGAVVGESNWLVAVASPSAVVLEPVRDAQIIATLVIGLLIVGFLWVGTYFIQQTIHSILRLVSGALVFAGGKLDYTIQLPDAEAEFSKLAETMNNMALRIAAAEKEIDEKNKEFISVGTHELRTPLTAIIGNLSLITDDFGDQLVEGPVKKLILEVQNGAIRLRDLINDLLDVARMEGGRQEFNIQQIDISKLATDVVDTLQVTAKEKTVTLAYQPTGFVPVMADESRLRIVLNNFVSNAIKYNRPNGTVTVSHSMKDNKLVTAIADTGLGIPDDQKAHMFEKFFRVQNDDRKHVTGTGLGMFITREYILKMGGELWFESVHGKGTTFYFSLPVASSQPAATEASAAQVSTLNSTS